MGKSEREGARLTGDTNGELKKRKLIWFRVAELSYKMLIVFTYFRTCTSEVLSYESTKVLSYFESTRTRSVLQDVKYEGTKVCSYVLYEQFLVTRLRATLVHSANLFKTRRVGAYERDVYARTSGSTFVLSYLQGTKVLPYVFAI